MDDFIFVVFYTLLFPPNLMYYGKVSILFAFSPSLPQLRVASQLRFPWLLQLASLILFPCLFLSDTGSPSTGTVTGLESCLLGRRYFSMSWNELTIGPEICLRSTGAHQKTRKQRCFQSTSSGCLINISEPTQLQSMFGNSMSSVGRNPCAGQHGSGSAMALQGDY